MHTTMRLLLLLLIFIFEVTVIGCNQSINNSEKGKIIDSLKTKDSIGENKTIDINSDIGLDTTLENDKNSDTINEIIFALTEVKERANYVETQSKGKRHLSIWIYETPEKTGKEYYWVKVVENNGVSLETHFNFYVYQKNLEIKYLDTIKDSILSLDTWRKCH